MSQFCLAAALSKILTPKSASGRLNTFLCDARLLICTAFIALFHAYSSDSTLILFVKCFIRCWIVKRVCTHALELYMLMP